MASENKIGVVTATIVAMNAMIGAGIFSVPAALGAAVGPAGLITYLFVIIAVWCMGSAMAQLAKNYPQEGSFYTYARQWGGHYVGLIAASLYLIGMIIAMGHLIQTIGAYLLHYFPSLSEFSLGLLALIFLTVLNMVGVHLSQAGQMILICTTIFPLLTIIGICLTHGSIANYTPFTPYGWHSVFSATRIVIFGFFGFESAASLYTRVENPERNVPRALVTSIVLVGILYTLFVGAIIFAVPLNLFLVEKRPLSEILSSLFQHGWLLELIHAAILSAVLGTVHSMIWASGELFTALVRQTSTGTKQKKLKQLATPQNAVLTIATLILGVYLTLGDPNIFFNLTALFMMCAFGLAMTTLVFDAKRSSTFDKAKTYIGLATAVAIFYFAAENIVEVVKARNYKVDASMKEMV